MNLSAALHSACVDVGILFRDVPADARFHETDVEGDRRGRGDGRIKLFPGVEGGIVCNGKGKRKGFFAYDARNLSGEERAELVRKRREAVQRVNKIDARARQSHAIEGGRERIREALGYISPDCDRDRWVRMAMAVKSELGEAGFDIWDAWSQQGESYDARGARDTWRSIKADGKVTIGTLFREAKAHGWVNGSHSAPSPEEVAKRKRRAEERAAQDEAEIDQERAQAAAWAEAVWKAATDARPDHLYLVSKKVAPPPDRLREIDARELAEILGYQPQSSGKPLMGRVLVAPVFLPGRRFSTLELIDEAGGKAALRGRGTKTGAYWTAQESPEGDGPEPLLIGEGIATVLSAVEATCSLGVSALSASNLPAVAKTMRQRYRTRPIVVLADLVKATGEADDRAVEAARAVGGLVAVPDFGRDRPPAEKDMNDLARLCGLDAVRQAIEGAKVPTLPVAVGQQERATEAAGVDVHPKGENVPRSESALVLLSGESIRPEPISWLWNGWLAQGKLHILAGAPGTGKTTLALALAATVATGGRWPDGSRASPGSVLVASFEDDPTDTLAPRLMAMGADMSRIRFLSGVREGDRLRSLHAGDHASLLAEAIRADDVRLVIVDPVISALGTFDSHRNAETRQALQPLADAAAGTKAAVLGVAHFSKGTAGREPLERVSGSLAFGALARVVLGAARVKGDDGTERRMFLRLKSNIGPDTGGFSYELQQEMLPAHPEIFASRVLWGEAVEGSARELLAEAELAHDGEGSTLTEAKRFLMGLLADGPVPTTAIQADANGAGYSLATIRRAKDALGVKATKAGMKKGWEWSLPEGAQENAKVLNKKTWASSVDDEHLRRNQPRETDIVEGEL